MAASSLSSGWIVVSSSEPDPCHAVTTAHTKADRAEAEHHQCPGRWLGAGIDREIVGFARSEAHTSETPVTNARLVCRPLLETKTSEQVDRTAMPPDKLTQHQLHIYLKSQRLK